MSLLSTSIEGACRTRPCLWPVFCLAGLLLATLTYPVAAQSLFERLVMPGELSEAHAKLQAECSNCHEAFSKSSQRQRCLDCHKDVARDVRESTGFHGLRREVGGQECKHCHTEHKGRGADIVLFDPETFDHLATDFRLRGAHAGVRCAACHEAGKKFRDAPGQCVDCHQRDEPHKGRLGRECGACHNEVAWRKTAAFDHSRTKFPLLGKHADVTCQACHAGEVYKGLATACVDCHRVQDAHAGRFGERCDNCHRPESWTAISFDHDRQTKFPLTGKHEPLKCAECHKGDLYRDKLATACASCHGDEDPHRGQLGRECETCHSPAGWREKVAFDHEITRFPLIGLHAVAPCEACHLTASFKDAPIDCVECHRKDDFHKGRLGTTCGTCHNPNGWARWIFDHDTQTRYPLRGAHAGLDCHACHKQPDGGGLRPPTACARCHSKDNVHGDRFTADCSTCHTSDRWRQSHFDHNTRTRFRLDGAHLAVGCHDCHTGKRKPPQACIGCHAKDDVHHGQFGPQCAVCHITASFRQVRIRK